MRNSDSGQYLDKHAAYLAAHKWALKALDELENSATDLAQIAADNAPHKFKIGPCPGLDCTGTLRVVLRRDDDLLPSELACNGQPAHTWPAGEWRMLERRLHMNAGAARRLAVAIAPMKG